MLQGQSKYGVLVAASNFPLLQNVPIVSNLQDKLLDLLHRKIFVFLLNDADAAVAAEVWGDTSGKYDHCSNIAMVTIGSGDNPLWFYNAD